jgi:hypothetical protein
VKGISVTRRPLHSTSPTTSSCYHSTLYSLRRRKLLWIIRNCQTPAPGNGSTCGVLPNRYPELRKARDSEFAHFQPRCILRNFDSSHTGCFSESGDFKNVMNSKCFHLFSFNTYEHSVYINEFGFKFGSKMALAAFVPVLTNQNKNSVAKSLDRLTHALFWSSSRCYQNSSQKTSLDFVDLTNALLGLRAEINFLLDGFWSIKVLWIWGTQILDN